MKLKYAAALSLLCASTAHASSVFINEIHYDNTGGDVGEFFEIAAPIGTDLTGWSVVLYNGSNGTSYSTSDLSNETLVQNGNYSFVAVYPSSIQNGSPDGIALVDNNGNLVQFLSYEGAFGATDGPANGIISIDIGVSEPSSTPIGFSLQLAGSGSEYADFVWSEADAETPNASNNAQTFVTNGGDLAPSIVSITPADGDTNVAPDANINITFSEDVAFNVANSVNCINEASISVTLTGEGSNYVVNPDQDFPEGDTCSFTVSAVDVTDLDDEADNMEADVTITFSVADPSIIVDLVINEFLADPAGDITGDANGDGVRDSSEDEFFEIINNGVTAVDVSGYTYSDGFGVRHVFPAQSVIEAGCAIVVFGGGQPDGLFGGALVQTSSTNTIGLNNGGDTLTITNGENTFEVSYGDEGSNNQSLTLNPDITGQTYEQHSTIAAANGALFSPGTKIDGSKFAGCTIPDETPTVVEINPVDGATEVAVDTSINVVFSEDVTVSPLPSLSCSLSGEVALTTNSSGANFTFVPANELSNNETCTFTIEANSVTDTDGTPDMLETNFVSSFSTSELLVCLPPEAYTLISAIQGSGSATSFAGQTVSVQAVVTAIKQDGNSFFIQEESADNDADPATSEGILVFNNNPENTPAVGDVVDVRGTVSEFFDMTQISISSAPLVCGNGSITPSQFSLPFSAQGSLESLEGMLVTNSSPLTVTDTFVLARFGQVTLSNGKLFEPNNISLPGSAENADITLSNSLNSITMDDGSDTQNPEVLPFPTGGLSANNTLRLGDTVSSVVAIVDYRFGDFQLVPVEAPTFVASNPRTSEPQLAVGNLKIASLNVLNFFNTIDSGPDICGPTSSQDCRGADANGTDLNGLTEFDRQKVKTIAAISAINADIIGFMEIENDGFGPNSSIVELVEGVNAVMGEGTYSIVENSGPIGTDAITVAMIYKAATVSLSGDLQILDSNNSISDNDGPLFDDGRNRPSLIQKFALVENGEEVVVSVNHLKSKGSSCGAGDDDTTTGQGNCNLTRTRAAQALTAFLAQQFGETPTLIIGDLNAYALEDPIRAITDANGPAFTDLANLFGGNQAYSYSFDGELGYLDHALASPSLLNKVVDTTEWHINADEPIVLNYNFEFKSDTQIVNFFAPNAYRMSDHDPVVVSLLLVPTAVMGDFDMDGDVDINDVRGLIRAVQRRESIDMAFDLNNDGAVTVLDARVMMTLCTRIRCAAQNTIR